MEETIKKISKLKNLWKKTNNEAGVNITDEELNIIEQIGNFFSAGSFYYYIFNYETQVLEYISKGAETVYEMPLKSMNLERLLERTHPEDLTKMIAKEEVVTDFYFNKISPHQVLDYKVVYLNRIVSTKGVLKTLLHQTKVIKVDENGRVHKVLGVHTDITHLNTPIDHKVSFISSRYQSYYSVSTEGLELENQENSLFSKRELEIIIHVSNGFTFTEIAELLFLAPETVKTHKKNILKKAGAKNMAHLITFCIREGII